MTGSTDIRFPFPEKYIRGYVSRLFKPIVKGENVTSIWMATAGRRVVNKFLVDNPSIFTTEVPNISDYLLVYIEPLDLTEENLAGYLRLIGKGLVEACGNKQKGYFYLATVETKIFEDEQAPYSKLLDSLKTVMTKIIDHNLEIILMLGEIDERSFINSVFGNNLRSLWNRFDNKLHYVFLIKDVRLVFSSNPYGDEFGYIFFQNLLYVPVSAENEDYLMDYFEVKTKYILSPDMRKLVSQMCDGHPYFLKLAYEALSKEDDINNPLTVERAKEILKSNYEIRATSDRMLGVLTDSMKRTLKDASTKQLISLSAGEDVQCLVKLGFVKKYSTGVIGPFCGLLEEAILKNTLPEVKMSTKNRELYFDATSNTIVFNGKQIEDNFARQEYEILSYFIKNPNKVHNRDEMAKAIWGDQSYDKYSDWAIDQLISKLRKKLQNVGFDGKNLVTIRGRGYKFLMNQEV